MAPIFLIVALAWNWDNITGFDLTFQKWFVIFPNENKRKTDVKCCPPWLSWKRKFATLDYTNSLKRHFLTFFSWGWVTYRFLYAIRHNDARGWGCGSIVIANNISKIKNLEFQSSWIVIYYKIHFRVLLQPFCKYQSN